MIRIIIFIVLSTIAINHFALCERNSTAIDVRNKAIELIEDGQEKTTDYISEITK